MGVSHCRFPSLPDVLRPQEREDFGGHIHCHLEPSGAGAEGQQRRYSDRPLPKVAQHIGSLYVTVRGRKLSSG